MFLILKKRQNKNHRYLLLYCYLYPTNRWSNFVAYFMIKFNDIDLKGMRVSDFSGGIIICKITGLKVRKYNTSAL